MAIVAIFQDAVQRDGRWAFSVVYVDAAAGVKVMREYVSATPPDDVVIESVAHAEVQAMSVPVVAGKLTYAPGAVINLAPPPASVPNGDDKAREAYFADVVIFDRLTRWVGRGVIAPDDKQLADVAARLKANWLEAYRNVDR